MVSGLQSHPLKQWPHPPTGRTLKRTSTGQGQGAPTRENRGLAPECWGVLRDVGTRCRAEQQGTLSFDSVLPESSQPASAGGEESRGRGGRAAMG